MKLEHRKYLHDIRTAAEKIERFIQGKTENEYCSSDLLKSAVERQFEIIGEALNRMIKQAPDMQKEIPNARDIISFRNLLIHGYTQVDDSLVYNIATTRIPGLLIKIRELLNQK